MSPFETALKAAAFDSASIGLEVRAEDGEIVLANSASGAGLGPLPEEPRAEIVVAGRLHIVERFPFTFAGKPFSIVAAIDFEDERKVRDDLFARAYFDPSTGLPNRELCDRTIAELIAERGDSATPFAVVIAELERFAEIVAFQGVESSEALAARIGERLARASGKNDILARVGLDKFCLVLPDPGDAAALIGVCRGLASRGAEPFLVDGLEIFASLGVGACYWPSADGTPEGLRRKAEAAARVSAGEPRLYEAEMEGRHRARAREENALRLAIRDHRIGCAFQPKVNFRTGEIDSLEVLMRWRTEDGTWRTPGNFITLAHETGLMNEITAQVFDATLRSLDAANAAFGSEPRLGFNIASKQACDTRFMRGFLDRLEASGHARRFTLEITEEAFLPAGPFQARILPAIREIGAHLSIDDFGSGYSSLAMLANIEADELKVDRSLITDIDKRPRNQSLLRATESLGAALNMRVVVEGVETQAEFAYLRDYTGLSLAQGYFFARPIVLPDPAETVERPDAARGRAAPTRAREGRGSFSTST